jgi:hypothetical protein
MALPNYSYGTSATVYGKNSTDSYYVLDAAGGGGQVIQGNLTVTGGCSAGSFSTVGGVSAADATLGELFVTGPGGAEISVLNVENSATFKGPVGIEPDPTSGLADVVVNLYNVAGQGIQVGVDGTTGVATISPATLGVAAAAAITINPAGQVTIPQLQLAGTAQKVAPANEGSFPSPGAAIWAVAASPSTLNISAAFATDITHVYRFSFAVNSCNMAPQPATGVVNISIEDATTPANNQIYCWAMNSSDGSSTPLAARGQGAVSGTFQPNCTSCVFTLTTTSTGGAAGSLSLDSGAGATFFFLVEDLGVVV